MNNDLDILLDNILYLIFENIDKIKILKSKSNIDIYRNVFETLTQLISITDIIKNNTNSKFFYSNIAHIVILLVLFFLADRADIV